MPLAKRACILSHVAGIIFHNISQYKLSKLAILYSMFYICDIFTVGNFIKRNLREINKTSHETVCFNFKCDLFVSIITGQRCRKTDIFYFSIMIVSCFVLILFLDNWVVMNTNKISVVS